MANLHIAGSTEIDDTGVTLNAIKDSKIIDTSSSNYIKFKDGTQICYGTVTCRYSNNNYMGTDVTFPKEFTNTPIVVVTRYHNDNSYNNTFHTIKVSTVDRTKCTIWIGSSKGEFGSNWIINVNYIAIGK